MTDSSIDLAGLCRRVREERGYSQSYVAKGLNMSIRQIYRIEAGESAPSWRTLDRWLNLCGYRVTFSAERKW